MGIVRRYSVGARWYDALSGEWPVYGAGRRAGLELLALRPGDAVIDLGCGTGLNFPALRDAVGPDGVIVGIDRSPDMLAAAARRIGRAGWRNVRLIQADASMVSPAQVRRLIADETGRDGADALVATYALSVMRSHAADAWRRARGILRPGASVVIVDLQPPVGSWRPLSPLARAACALGGADITLQPWRMLDAAAEPGSVQRRLVRGGHIVATAGRLP